MRIAFLIGALGAITTSSALPWNTTAAISNFTGGIQPYGHRGIPVNMKKCMGDTLSKKNYLTAKQLLVVWSEAGGYIHPGGVQAMSYPGTKNAVTWYVCNCKLLHWDRVPEWELDDVQRILEEACGEWQSGWVWSKKWQKGFNVVPTEWYKNQIANDKRICPPHCSSPFG
ncbi:hypothetical protein F4823DRAFT_632362 [Ustulina deusta]|nr:hypothetical protein F4823DRAFT_632362 [Ustulina deusta]